MVLYMTKVAGRVYEGELLLSPRPGVDLSRQEYTQGTKDTETLGRSECPVRMQAREGRALAYILRGEQRSKYGLKE